MPCFDRLEVSVFILGGSQLRETAKMFSEIVAENSGGWLPGEV